MAEKPPKPSQQENLALFRATIIGALASRELARGELQGELRALSEQRFRPPGSPRTRTYSVATLERWRRAYRGGGLNSLRRKRRRDAKRARALTDRQRQLLLDIRAEHPHASVPLILRTLYTAGIFPDGLVSPQTVRRLYAENHLPRQPRANNSAELDEVRQRLRWRAPFVCSLWQADVCHALKIQGSDNLMTHALVHALLDDHSRYIVRIEVRATETEQDMLEIFANAVREHGAPDRLYADGGATYSGDTLPLVCERLGTHLIHPQPGDPSARGKVERLFRTLREQCIDYVRSAKTLHDVFVRVLAWREQYHNEPHSSLMGRTPAQVWREGIQSPEHQQRRRLSEEELRRAYIIRTTRKVRKDCTITVDGKLFEVEAAWMAGKTVTLVRSLLMPDEVYIELENKRCPLSPCDPVRNASRGRKPSKKRTVGETNRCSAFDFRPEEAALHAMLNPRRKGNDR
jgi:transposase InsO family protein